MIIKLFHMQVGPKLLVLGDEAQSYGLGVSLIERLHTQYDSKVFSSKQFCSVTLLTNYRSHCGILMLPSSIYYQSTVQYVKKNDKPHHLSSFPLAFVCSDISKTVERTTGKNKSEADVLIKEVEKYFNTWPRNWNTEDRKICIMSPSPDQVCSSM